MNTSLGFLIGTNAKAVRAAARRMIRLGAFWHALYLTSVFRDGRLFVQLDRFERRRRA